MRAYLLVAATAFLGSVVVSAHAGGAVPCETTLAKLRSAEKEAKLSEADKVAELEGKGIARCNADDDGRANEFFAQAMMLLGD
jgi:hypothetical protein